MIDDELVDGLLGRLRALRSARGLTQEQLAERAGLTYKHYQAVEAGRKRDMRLSTLCRLAVALDLKPYQLLMDEEATRPDSKKSIESPKSKIKRRGS